MQILMNVPNPKFAVMEQHVPILKVLILVLAQKKPYRIPILTSSALA